MLGRAWPVRSPQSGGLSVRELRSGTDSAQSQVPHSAVAALRWLRLRWGARAVGPRRPAWGAVHAELPTHRGPRSSRCRLAACGVTQTSQRVPPQPPRALGSRPRRLPEPGACTPLSVPRPPVPTSRLTCSQSESGRGSSRTARGGSDSSQGPRSTGTGLPPGAGVSPGATPPFPPFPDALTLTK